MKKIILTVIIAVVTIVNLNAQERDQGDIELIPFISYTEASFNGDNADAYGGNTSVSFGVKGDFFFNDRWSLRSGLLYDALGADVGVNGVDVNLNYLSIPINANWHFGSTRKWNLNFGLTPGFLLNAELDGFGDVKDEVKSFQLAVSYGIGYKLEISDRFSLLFDGQGLFGVSNINDINEGDLKQMNVGSSIGLGGVFLL